MKKSKPQHSTPSPFTFGTLEEQTSHALRTLRLLERVLEDHHTTSNEFDEQDVDAMALLLYHARLLLDPLDLNGVAAALDLGHFTMIQSKHIDRFSIGCAQCGQEKSKSEVPKKAAAVTVGKKGGHHEATD